ncbi:MAG: glucoamylase family protein, partial [Tepidisphaeraceae bacterium]
GSDRLLPRLAANEELLREAYGLVADAVKRDRRITPAAEWFLDNYHLIEEQIRTARRHLPRGYSRELPQLNNGPSAGYPRAYAIALELIAHVDGRVDAESLRAFVTSYQSVTPLRLGELWAIPIMLRLGLLENLRRVVARVAAGRRDRERAAYWIERMLDVVATAPAEVVLVLAEMVKENPPLSTAFISEFASRMQGRGPAVIFALTWLEHRVAEQGQTIETVFQQASQNQATDQVSICNSIGSLRFLGAMEWRNFVETMSGVEQILRTDPAGVYPAMDFVTRDQYRHAVEEIARHSLLSEDEVAHRAIALAHDNTATGHGDQDGSPGDNRKGHVGYFLVGRGRQTLERAATLRTTLGQLLRGFGRRFPLSLYIGSIALTTALVTALVLWWAVRHGLGHWSLASLGILLCVCASQLAMALVNWGIMLLVRPRILPRLDFSKGIPDEHRTIVAVPTIITDAQEIDDLVEAMEVRFLANRDENLSFALLTDFADAPEETIAGDKALLQRVRNRIESLNAKHPGDRFFLFHRARRWNAKENVWMGWERKRGKLEDFNEVLRDPDRETGRFASIVGPTDRLQGIRYVITLDSDTQLPRDSAWQLVGTMAHPLNRPRYDEKLGRVTEGYGILQPRVGISMPSANRSRFARLFAGEPGIDPYTHAVSDVYQDVFEEGSFVGKGIYDVDAFQRALAGRLPENRILSHDLLEGGYARSGLVSDVLLFEDYPSSYPADVSRRYRWIRGDWQIVQWLLPRVPGRREVASGQLPFASEKGDSRLTPLNSGLPTINYQPSTINSPRRVRNPISALSRWKILDNVRRSVLPGALLALLIVGWLLPGAGLSYTLVVIGILLLPAILNGAAELTRRPADLPVVHNARMVGYSVARQVLQQGFTLACLPYDAFVSTEAIVRTAVRLLVTGRKLLEWRTARTAQHAAFTNIPGFYSSMWVLPLTATICLLALCLVRPHALVVATPVIALWFAAPGIAFWLSRTVKPQPPHLSAEDLDFLGRVARSTWRFFEAFVGPDDNYLPPDNFQEDPPVGLAHRTSPTNIGLSLLANLAAYDFGYIAAAGVIERTTRTLATLDKLERHRGHFYNWYDTRTLEPLQPRYVSTVDSGNLAGHLLTLAAGLDELASGVAAERAPVLRQLAVRCLAFADIDYEFLYDKNRHLLSIGYNVADRRLDSGFYDLLASEARLASFVAIAQEKLPAEHWFNLGRSLTNTGRGTALVSWSGSMFEYLMPLLVMPTYEHTLLDETYHAVVRRQIEYGRERGVPWGVSESGYTKIDAHLNYQYRAFGVPGLGFKRGLADDLVVAPYASAMALMVVPEPACANLRRLAKEERLGEYGFYEAVDYTPSRLPRGQESATVRSYMAHHQGIVFLSLAYLLLDRPMQRRFQSEPAFQATDLLLQERIPKAPSTFPHPAEVSDAHGAPAETGSNFRIFTTPRTVVPEVHLLSNGRYHVALTAAGGGYSRWRDLAVTRWREDSTRDCWGTFCYLRDIKTGEFWSAAQQPTTREPNSYEAIYSQGRAEFRRCDGAIETHLEISVSPEDDIELRRISITNRGRNARTIELTSYAEVVLATPAADAAHPAFSNLFVQTQLVRQRQAILCTRRPRSAGERPPWMLHLMTVHGATATLITTTSYETSRDQFIGRGRTLADPAAMHRPAL